jgi:threonine/homoserine/homoserine lactone efflux protein
MLQALLAHPQAAQEALGVLCACYVSWLHKEIQMFKKKLRNIKHRIFFINLIVAKLIRQ